MKKSVTLSALATMSTSEREAKIREIVASSRGPLNGELHQVEGEIEAFETRFQIDSETMRREVRSGIRPETWDVCRWLMALRTRDELRKA